MKTKSNSSPRDHNAEHYAARRGGDYVEGAPHLKHNKVREYQLAILREAMNSAMGNDEEIFALDLGAGEGAATLPLLSWGAKVTAIDLTEVQMKGLGQLAKEQGSEVELVVGDAIDFLESTNRKFNLVVANSVLHHIPDYERLVRALGDVVKPGGVFVSLQDPLRYDTLGFRNRSVSDLMYIGWRVTQKDVIGGVKRRLRRLFGIYKSDDRADMVEYHVVRKGVDQEMIKATLEELGFVVVIRKYFSTQSSFGQRLGDWMEIENHFCLIGAKRGAEWGQW